MKLKNKTKCIISFYFVLVFLFSTNTVLAVSYTDISENHGAYKHIYGLSEAKIISGYPDKTYRPENPVGYLEVMKLLQGIINPSENEISKALKENSSITNKYNVPSWAEESVCIALEKNIITEKNLKQVAIEGLISNTKENNFPSRQLIAVYYARALNLEPNKDHSILSYKDLNKLGNVDDIKIGEVNIADYLSALVHAGIFSSQGSDGYFAPNRHIRRDEMAFITDLSYKYLMRNDDERTEKDFELFRYNELKRKFEKLYLSNEQMAGISSLLSFEEYERIAVNSDSNEFSGMDSAFDDGTYRVNILDGSNLVVYFIEKKPNRVDGKFYYIVKSAKDEFKGVYKSSYNIRSKIDEVIK